MIDILKGCYPYFSVFALAVIILRIRYRQWSSAETIVLGCFLAHLVLEVFQSVAGDGKWDISRRYFLPAAPLLFAWTAYGLWELNRKLRSGFPRCIFRIAIGCFLLFLVFDGIHPSLKNRFSERKQEEMLVANAAAPIIRKHYNGPKAENPPLHKLIYRSPYLPVVYCRYCSVGFSAEGRNEPSPFLDKPDYWILPVSVPAPADGKKVFDFFARRPYIIYERE